MKYKVGDEIVLRYEVLECDERFGWYRVTDNGYVSDDHIEKYAAKAAPAPVSTAWEPKAGDRVLVEAEYKGDPEYGDHIIFLEHHDKTGNSDTHETWVSRSAIIGPAPARARFAVGDVVVYVPTVEVVIIREVNEIAGCYTASQDGRPTFIALEADLLTLDEARERLGKK